MPFLTYLSSILLAAGLAAASSSEKTTPATTCDVAGSYRFRFLSNGHDGWWFRFKVEGMPARATLVEDVAVLGLKAGNLDLAVDPKLCKLRLSAEGKAFGKLVIALALDAQANTITGKLTRTEATDPAERHLAIRGMRDRGEPKSSAACIVPGLYRLDFDPKARWRNASRDDKRSCKRASQEASPVFVRVEPFGKALVITERESEPPHKEAAAVDRLEQHDACNVTAKISDSELTLKAELKFAEDGITGTATEVTKQIIEDDQNIWDCVGKKVPLRGTRVE
jgi:hypothetical protein